MAVNYVWNLKKITTITNSAITAIDTITGLPAVLTQATQISGGTVTFSFQSGGYYTLKASTSVATEVESIRLLDTNGAGNISESLVALIEGATPQAETITRTNLANSPTGVRGWVTSSSYVNSYDPAAGRRQNTGARKYIHTGVGRYFPYGRGAGQDTITWGNNVNTPVGLPAVTGGLPYGAGLWVKADRDIPNASVTLRWITSTGTEISGQQGTKITIPANTWGWISTVSTAPATAAHLNVEFALDMGADQATAYDAVSWATDVLIEQRATAPASAEFFDGNTPVSGTNYSSWTDKVDLSTSYRATSGTLVLRNSVGRYAVTMPIAGDDATPKRYVDMVAASANGMFTNVMAEGVKADGSDETLLIQRAVNKAGWIYFPAGTYVHTGITVPPGTYLWGAGIGLTILLIKAGTAWNNRSIAPQTQTSGPTKNWGVYEMTVDGNQPNRPQTGGSGGIFGTNISVTYSEYVWITKVESVRANQHCFDVTASSYLYNGDATFVPENPFGSGKWSPNPSRYVWLSHCRADQHGDDGFTTHGSEFIWMDHCWAGGTWKASTFSYSNSNGFEIDDGSRHVWLSHCYSQENAHGFEVKGHGDVPAAFDVHLDHCVSYHDEIGFSLRHIGHHTKSQIEAVGSSGKTKSANDVTLNNCTVLYPRRVFYGTATDSEGTDSGNELRALSIGAYRGATITGFHAIGDPTATYNGSTVVFEYFCEDIIFTGFHIEGFVNTSGYDIYSKGGDQPASFIHISNGRIKNSAANTMSLGSAGESTVANVRVSRDVAGSPNGTCITAFGASNVYRGNRISGFAPNYNLSGGLFTKFETPIEANVAYVP